MRGVSPSWGALRFEAGRLDRAGRPDRRYQDSQSSLPINIRVQECVTELSARIVLLQKGLIIGQFLVP